MPVPCNSTSTSAIRPNSIEADRLRQIALFILDETSILSLDILHCVDRWLRDIVGNNIPFGGITFLLGGDFRQTLPVVKRENAAQIVEQCVLRSLLWSFITVFHLSGNHRIRENKEEFSEWLLKLGNNELQKKKSAPFAECIEIPNRCVTQDVLLDIFPDDLPLEELGTRAILTPRNDVSPAINSRILEKLPHQEKWYNSYDQRVSDEPDAAAVYTTEVVNSLTPSGLPQHRLALKSGAIIMLLRNHNRSQGLCNGTRQRVLKMFTNFIEAEILIGFAAGNKVFIPNISLSPSYTNLPFKLKRTQIPIRLAYAMTIEKSQEESFEKSRCISPRTCLFTRPAVCSLFKGWC